MIFREAFAAALCRVGGPECMRPKDGLFLYVHDPMILPILDRDTKYSDAFRGVLVREGIQVIRLPPRAPVGAQLRYLRKSDTKTPSLRMQQSYGASSSQLPLQMLHAQL